MTISIPLSKTSKKYAGRYETIISDEDADLADLSWQVFVDTHTQYALHGVKNSKSIRLHRVILERVIGRSLESHERPDHINGNGLDNRRENLRLATIIDNARNRRIGKDNTTGFKGICPNGYGKWKALIRNGGKQIYLGTFNTPKEAHEAYCKAAKDFHGDFANGGKNENT